MTITLSATVEEFASRRRGLLERAEEQIRPAVSLALVRLGLPQWEGPVMEDLAAMFDITVEEETDARGGAIDDLRAEFLREVREALSNTKRVEGTQREDQVERITRWLAVATVNAATEAATAADPDPLGLEWVDMNDGNVRDTHREASGQTVPIGGLFEVGGVQVSYPGQPVGDPALWLNCRCLARPVALSEMAPTTTTFGVDMDDDLDTTEDQDAPEITDEDLYAPVPWHGVLAPEGVPSGDGRMFAVESLRHRDLPLTLKYMPADADAHQGSYAVGKIERIWREDGKVWGEGTFDYSPEAYEVVRLLAEEIVRGVSVDVDDATASLSGDEEDMLEFSSARIAAATICTIPAFAEAYVALGPASDRDQTVERSTAEQSAEALAKDLEGMGATVVRAAAEDVEMPPSTPAEEDEGDAPTCQYGEEPATHKVGEIYSCDQHMEQAIADAGEGAEVVDLNPEAAPEEFAPVPRKTKDGPGWITHPKPTKRITDYWVDGVGAAKIGWGAPGDFNRCRMQLGKYVQNPEWLAGLCANLHYRATRTWPGRRHAGGTESMSDSITASVAFAETRTELPADWFRQPDLDGPTPMTVTEDGRVFGHIATWGVCHIGIGDACVTAPKSATNYSYFLTGETLTDAGPVPVGQISLGGGHADMKAGVRAAMSHYDSTSAAVADVTAGEDEFGIWIAGAIRPDVDQKQRAALRAAALSGDWRRVGGNLELVAALAVNVPGFPIPRPSLAASGVEQTALVAASVVQQEEGTDLQAVIAAAVDQRLARLERERKVTAAQQTLSAVITESKQNRLAKARAALAE